MKLKPVVDYRKFSLKKLNTDEFRHVKLLLYWPAFGLIFMFLEQFRQVEQYIPMHCFLDDYIPFCEWFVIPYMFWFVFLVGIHLYTLLFDIDAFRKLMRFIILTYTVSLVIFILFPTCQNLRPVVFQRDNVLIRFMNLFYRFDTNTNVCPSLHVVGSLAGMFAAWNAKGLQSRGWKIAVTVMAVMISISTVFLRQHSVLDLVVALLLCLAAYPIAFKLPVPSRRLAYLREEK